MGISQNALIYWDLAIPDIYYLVNVNKIQLLKRLDCVSSLSTGWRNDTHDFILKRVNRAGLLLPSLNFIPAHLAWDVKAMIREGTGGVIPGLRGNVLSFCAEVTNIQMIFCK